MWIACRSLEIVKSTNCKVPPHCSIAFARPGDPCPRIPVHRLYTRLASAETKFDASTKRRASSTFAEEPKRLCVELRVSVTHVTRVDGGRAPKRDGERYLGMKQQALANKPHSDELEDNRVIDYCPRALPQI